MDKTSIREHFSDKNVLSLYYRKPLIVRVYDWLLVFSPQCLPLGVFRSYNIKSGFWRWHTIDNASSESHPKFEDLAGACAVAIGDEIYVYGAASENRATLWKLTKTEAGPHFTWSVLKPRGELPRCRVRHACWGHGGRMWLFGGQSTENPSELVQRSILVYFEPAEEKWYKCTYGGTTPEPGMYEAAVWEDTVWLAGGTTGYLEHVYELDLNSLQFSVIQPFPVPAPSPVQWFSFSAVADNQLVLHGGSAGTNPGDDVITDTWVLSLESHSWRKYPGEQDVGRYGHTSLPGPDNSVIVFGGRSDETRVLTCRKPFTVTLQPRSLRNLATHAVTSNRHAIPESQIPKTLVNDIFGIW